MSGSLFYALAVGFTSGILARSFFHIGYQEALCVMLVTSALLLLWWRNGAGVTSTRMVALWCLLAAAVGVLRFDVAVVRADRAQLDHIVGQEVTIEGIVTREADVRERTRQLTLAVTTINETAASGNLLVITDRLRDIEYGDRIRVAGVVEAPETFETDFGRTFNYPQFLAARGIHHTMSFIEVELIERGAGNVLLHKLFVLKRTFMASLERALPEPSAGLGEGLLLGAKRAIGEDLEDAFRATGVIHIVVLSGYNITIVAEAVMRLLAVLFMPRTRFMIGAAVIVSFAVLVGLSATVLRASLMALLVLVARATGKTYAVLRALTFSACVMLLFNPYLLAFDPGFQLSFLATLGLILLGPLIESRLSLLPTTLQLREFVTATLSTQLFVLPLLLYSVGQLSLIAVIANMFVLIAVPFAMLFTFMTGALGLFALWLAMPVALIAHALLSYIIGAVTLFASLPLASIVIPAFPVWIMFAAYALLGLLLWGGVNRKSSRASMKTA